MLRSPIACALLLCYLAACMSWHVEEGVTPLQLISTKHPRSVRLTRVDGSQIALDEPRIAAGDSVTGSRNGLPASVAASDVTQVATRRVHAGKTIGLVFATGVVVAGTLLIACLNSNDTSGACSSN